MTLNLQTRIIDKLYIKDPQSSELGQNILKHSIILIDELGIESFTFKKLAERIHSAEASVYRYFENKHLLLIYLLNWYWEWIKFRINIQTMNINDPWVRLKKIFEVIVTSSIRNVEVEYIDEDILHLIVLREGHKAYHSKQIDEDNSQGFFIAYKELSEVIAATILEINNNYSYAHSTATMMLEMANNNLYYAQHLPRLTDFSNDTNSKQGVVDMLTYMAERLLKS